MSTTSDHHTTWNSLKDFINTVFFIKISINGAIPSSLGIRKGDIPLQEIAITTAFDNLLKIHQKIDEMYGYNQTNTVTLNLALKRVMTAEGVKTGTHTKKTDDAMLDLTKQLTEWFKNLEDANV